jgi:hypothetical protein
MSRPPLPLSVVVRPVSGADVDVVPFQALIDYFLTCNVSLSIVKGEPLLYDPSGAPPLVALVEKQYKPPSDQTGPTVMVLALVSPVGDMVNGELLNPMSRSVIAIYTQSSNFLNGSDEDRFQIFVHEIGHLINLVHYEADESYPTAMEQWADRQTKRAISDIWQSADHDVQAEDKMRFESYLSMPRRVCGLPMSRKSLDHAARETTMRAIEPWRSAFRDNGQDSRFDRRIPGMSLSCRIDKEQISLGEGLDFALVLELNQGATEVQIPAHIGLRFGNLSISVQEDHGSPRNLQAKTHTCGVGSINLLPGGQYRAAYSFFCDRHGLIFAVPGHYRIDVAIPELGLKAAPMRILVGAPVVLDLSDKRFVAFLGGPMRRSARASWSRVETLIAAETTPSTLRAYLAELCIAATPGRERNAEIFDLVANLNEVPQRVRERLALARLRHAIRHATDISQAIIHAQDVFASTQPNHPTLRTAIAQAQTTKKEELT